MKTKQKKDESKLYDFDYESKEEKKLKAKRKKAVKKSASKEAKKEVAFFGGSFQVTKSESASKKLSERSSRLQASVFFTYFDDKSPSSSNFSTEKSTEQRIYVKQL